MCIFTVVASCCLSNTYTNKSMDYYISTWASGEVG